MADGWEEDDGFRVVLSRRDFSGLVVAGAGARVQVLRFAWDCTGGPSWAALQVVGPSPAVLEAAEWLRCPVEIYSPLGELVWWGYVNSLYIGVGAVRLGVGLDDMANRVAARYMEAFAARPGTYQSLVTAWTWDAESQGEYGIKERVLEARAQYDADMAVGARNVELGRAGLPPVTVGVGGGVVGSNSPKLYCRGWFSTLGWRYYAQTAGKVENTSTNLLQPFGDLLANYGWGQRFGYTGPSWTALTLDVQLAKVGAPADSVKAFVCADSSGSPGAELGVGNVAAAGIGGAPAWYSVGRGAGVAMVTGAYYWVVLVRTGGVADANNHYRTWVDSARGFAAGGAASRLVNAGWVGSAPPVSLGFRVRGVQEHAAQVSVIVTGAGQFLTGTEIVGGSGVSSCQYRDGSLNGLVEVEALLRSGVGGRLLARVRSDRVLEVWPAPLVGGGAQYWLNGDGTVTDVWGGVLRAGQCVAGVWVGLGDVIPGNADVSHYGRVSPFWVEGSVYEVGERRLRLLGAGAVGLLKDDAKGVAGNLAL